MFEGYKKKERGRYQDDLNIEDKLFGKNKCSKYCVFLLGRMYDYHVLDMIELGIEKFVSLTDIKVRY